MPLRPQQVGVARVVVDHQLVDLLQPVRVALGELLVLHAEPPVRIARGKAAVGRDRVELVVVDDLEDRVEEVEPVAARIAPPSAAGCRPVRVGQRFECTVAMTNRSRTWSDRVRIRIVAIVMRLVTYFPFPRNVLIES